MKQSEIFYFDVDGTLLDNHSHKIPQSTIDALHKLKENGYKVALCTGRSWPGVQEVNVQDIVVWDGYVLANGGLVMDADRKIIHEATFKPEWVHNFINDHPEGMLIEGDELFIVGNVNETLTNSFKHFGIPEMYPVRDYNNEKVFNIMSYGYDCLTDTVKARIEQEATVILDQLGNREIIPHESGKQNGVRVLNDHLGLKRYAGFGDGHNDVEFLRGAHFAVAMGNGCDEVKQVAHYTTAAVSDNGIAEALKRYNVFKEI